MIEQVPTAVRDAAKRAFALRDPGATTLELVHDSLLNAPPAVGLRTLRFGAAGSPARVSVVVSEPEDGQRASLDIAVEPEGVEVTGVQREQDVLPVEQVGPARWVAGAVEHGLLCLLLESSGGRLRTSWMRI